MKRNRFYRILVTLVVTLILAGGALFSACDSGTPNEPGKPEKTLTAIEVTTPPEKTSYYSGDLFDSKGMVISAVYSDESKEALQSGDWAYVPTRPLSITDTAVTVTYNKKTVKYAITVTEETVTGETLRLEAEAAKLTGIFNKSAKDQNLAGGPLDCYNIVYNDGIGASGGAAINNFNEAGNVISWTVNASAAARAMLTVRVAARYKSSTIQTTSFDDMFTLSVGGVEYKTGKNVGPTGATLANNYYDFNLITCNVALSQGDNVISLTEVSGISGNLDYIELTSSATLTDKTDGLKHSSSEGLYVKKNPTVSEAGQLTDSCTKCGHGNSYEIPAFNTTDYDYKLVRQAEAVTDGLETWTLKNENYKDKDGKAFVFEEVIPATGRKDYILEAENAALTGSSNISGSNGISCANLMYKTEASGGLCLYSINKQGNTVTFKFTSDKPVSAGLSVRVASRVTSGKFVEVSFKDMYTVTVNGGEPVGYDVNVVPTEGAAVSSYDFHELDLGSVDLVERDNTIVLTVAGTKTGSNGVAGNLDYIKLSAAAEITEDKTGAFTHNNGWVELEKPTEEKEGYLVRGCKDCGKYPENYADDQKAVLPALTPAEPFYTYTVVKNATESEEGSANYSFEKDGQTFTYTVVLPKTGTGETPVDAITPDWLGSRAAGSNDKVFFNPADWTAAPVLEADGALKFTTNSRIDALGRYVEGDASKYNPTHNDTKHDKLLGKSWVYSMNIKSTGNFGMILFATSGATWGAKGQRGVFVEFSDGVITVKATQGNSGVGATSGQLNVNFGEYTRLDIVVTRFAATETDAARFGLQFYIGGKAVTFTGSNVNPDDSTMVRYAQAGYGNSIEIVPLSGAEVYINIPESEKNVAPQPEPPVTDGEEREARITEIPLQLDGLS